VIARIFRRFAAFLFVGSANRDYLKFHGVPDERLFFSPHAVDNDRFTAALSHAEKEARVWKRELGIPEGHRVVLFAGKFEPKKRPHDLLKAFRLAGVSNCSLLLVGAGELEVELRQEAAGCANAFFAPFQNQSRMPCVYAAADVVVLPSYGPRETWGLCINEAMCLAKPVIVSDHVGCARDLVRPGVNGFQFKAGDVDDLANCLVMAFRDPEHLRSAGLAGREWIQGYSYRQATAGVLEALTWLKQHERCNP
jgi:glycosyltransferase involved in cell wall biosynthesis